jgi:tRNA 2-thiouridine synthesizing protein A
MANSTEKSIDLKVDVIDLRGLRCPLPAIRIRKILATAAPSALYDIWVTDISAVHDIPLAVSDMGWKCLSTQAAIDSTHPVWTLRLAPHHSGGEPA